MDETPGALAARAVAVGSRRTKPEPLPGEARRIGYLYVAPAFLLYAAFNLFPLGQGDQRLLLRLGRDHDRHVGRAGQLHRVLHDPAIRSGYAHVLVLMLFYSFMPIVIGLFLAAVLSRIRIRGLTFFRMLLFLPLVITDVATAVAWIWMYDVDGPISTAMRWMGLGHLVPSAGWLGDFNTALPAVGVFGMWGQFGFCLILFLAGVMKIPASLYEAARVDGANAVREFFAVTLPGLRYELQVVLVLSVIGTLGTFDEIYVLTSGGPGHATTVPAYLVWQRMFLTGQVGSAAALGIILMLIVFAVTLRTQPPDGTGGRGVTTTTSRTQVTFNYLLIILCSMVAIYPLVGVFLASLYPAGTSTSPSGFALPPTFAWHNYVTAWQEGKFAASFTTSIIVAAVMVPASVVLSIIAGYAFATMRFRGSKVDLLSVHPRVDHPDRGDDRAAVLRRARDGAARYLLGADPARGLRRARVRHLLDARGILVGSAVVARGRPDRRSFELEDALEDHGALRPPRDPHARGADLRRQLERILPRPRIHDQPDDGPGGPRQLLGPLHHGHPARVGGRGDRRDPDPDRLHHLPARVHARGC